MLVIDYKLTTTMVSRIEIIFQFKSLCYLTTIGKTRDANSMKAKGFYNLQYNTTNNILF